MSHNLILAPLACYINHKYLETTGKFYYVGAYKIQAAVKKKHFQHNQAKSFGWKVNASEKVTNITLWKNKNVTTKLRAKKKLHKYNIHKNKPHN